MHLFIDYFIRLFARAFVRASVHSFYDKDFGVMRIIFFIVYNPVGLHTTNMTRPPNVVLMMSRRLYFLHQKDYYLYIFLFILRYLEMHVCDHFNYKLITN